MAVCIGRKIVIMQWKHSAAWTAWCAASDTDTIEGFVYTKVSPVSVWKITLCLRKARLQRLESGRILLSKASSIRGEGDTENGGGGAKEMNAGIFTRRDCGD